MATKTLINVKFVDEDEAIDIMLNSDDYFKIMTPQERAIRMDVDYDPKNPISYDTFCDYAKKQIVKITETDKRRVLGAIGEVERCLIGNDFKGVFPDYVNIIVTSGLEDIRECAGYCRKNTICINLRALRMSSTSFFAHELFHIISQNNPDLREKLYNSLGFYECNDIELPSDLIPETLTNPDAPHHNVFIDIMVSDRGTKRKTDSDSDDDKTVEVREKKKIRVTPVLLYNKDSYGGFFSKLYIKLLRIRADETDKNKYVVYKPSKDEINEDESPLTKDDSSMTDKKVQREYQLYSVDDVDDFWEQIGDCQYYFHPDEILATRFSECVVRKLRFCTWNSTCDDLTKQEQKMIDILFGAPEK
jgi:uncharacterized protein YrzB (UPF0473 family)